MSVGSGIVSAFPLSHRRESVGANVFFALDVADLEVKISKVFHH